MKILIIEDDKTLATNLSRTLSGEGFAVDTAYNYSQGIEHIDINSYDTIVLDIGLPDGSGFELLTTIRNLGNETPVIIATARGDTEDRVKGLNLGADDYVPKPVDTQELIARIRAVVRRNSANALPVITIGNLVIKPAEHYAAVNNQPLSFTAKEFAVLEYLALHSGQIVTRAMLMEHVWGSDFESFSNVIDVYIKNLRKALSKHTDKNLIITIRGKGYILGKNDQQT